MLPPQHSMGQQDPHTFGNWHLEGVVYWYQQVVKQLRLGTWYFLLACPERETLSAMENPEQPAQARDSLTRLVS